MRSCCASIWFWSMLILTSFTAPLASVTTFSIIGCSVLHGPHHGAQKSTITGTVREASSTSLANLVWSLSLIRSAGGGAAGAAPFNIGSMRPRNGVRVWLQCGVRPPGTQGAVLAGPGHPLQHHPIAVRVLESEPFAVPIGVEGGNRRESGGTHALDGGLPFARVGQIEDDEIVRRRRAANGMAAGAGELEMIRRLVVAQHDAVEAVMVLEAVEHGEAEAVAIERQQGIDVVARTGDAQ